MVTGHCRHNPLAGASNKISPDGFRQLTNPHKKKKKKKKKRKKKKRRRKGTRTLQQIKKMLRLHPSLSK